VQFPGEFVRIFDAVQASLEARFGDAPNGAVAGCALLSEQRLRVAHAGDVRLWASVPEGPTHRLRRLTQDHNADRASEMERLRPHLRSGCFEVVDHPVRGGGYIGGRTQARLHFVQERRSTVSLQPTRGFGDPEFRPAFTHEPEIRDIDLDDALRKAVFVLCSDGAHGAVAQTLRKTPLSAPLAEFAAECTRRLKRRDDDATVIFFRMVL